VRPGDDEARHKPESVREISSPVLSIDEGLLVLVSDGESRKDANDNFWSAALIGQAVDQMRKGTVIICQFLSRPAGRSMSAINGD
jgi:hypothetical protein